MLQLQEWDVRDERDERDVRDESGMKEMRGLYKKRGHLKRRPLFCGSRGSRTPDPLLVRQML